MTTGDRIRNARKKAGLTQKELGEKLGVTGSLIGIYETNRRKPKPDTLQRMADALGISYVDLLSDEDIHQRIDSVTTQINMYTKAAELASRSVDKCINDLNALMGKHKNIESEPVLEKSDVSCDDMFDLYSKKLQILEDTLKAVTMYVNDKQENKDLSGDDFLDKFHLIAKEFDDAIQKFSLSIKEAQRLSKQ